jgi:putative oxidoreductase
LTTHTADDVRPRTGRLFVIWALSILVSATFFMAGGAKLASAPAMVAEFATIGVGQWFRYLTGALEVLGAIGLLIPRLGRYAAVLLCLITLGATIACLTVLGTNPTAAIMLLILSALIAFLRSR